MIQLKRAYEKPSTKDGERIMVERLWPRGLSKDRAALNLWLKGVTQPGIAPVVCARSGQVGASQAAILEGTAREEGSYRAASEQSQDGYGDSGVCGA
jgi:hypothetical protein